MIQQSTERPIWWFRTPLERVLSADILCMAFNREDTVGKNQGVYNLACGHQEVGRLGSQRLRCSSCQRIVDLGLDYDGFRHHGLADPLPREDS